MQAVWAFDFDGVVCDSVGESSLAAWKVVTVADFEGIVGYDQVAVLFNG